MKDGANVIKQQFFFLLSQGLIIFSSSWYSSLRRDKRVDHSEKKEGNEKNLWLNICDKDFTKSWKLMIIGVIRIINLNIKPKL